MVVIQYLAPLAMLYKLLQPFNTLLDHSQSLILVVEHTVAVHIGALLQKSLIAGIVQAVKQC